ncbi:hypothetical protein GCM10010286_42860 [Streptomyces toxytricini]|nr:hypothetical protein GCM10010286_42860 [Streptomyces toxytricini]
MSARPPGAARETATAVTARLFGLLARRSPRIRAPGPLARPSRVTGTSGPRAAPVAAAKDRPTGAAAGVRPPTDLPRGGFHRRAAPARGVPGVRVRGV